MPLLCRALAWRAGHAIGAGHHPRPCPPVHESALVLAPLVSIQVLRALAALAVAYGHAAHDAARLAPGFSAPFQGVSGAGVDLFFAISGFVMVISSARLFAADGGRGVFIRRRLARIVPIYWVATTLFLLTLVLVPGAVQSAGFSLLDVIKSYLFVPFRRAVSAA